MNDMPGIGHNQPVGAALDPDMLQARLERDYAAIGDRFTELELGAAQVPEIRDEAEAGRVTEWIGKQCRKHMSDAKEIHDQEKKPYLACGKIIDRFFLDSIKQLDKAIAPVERRIDEFLQKKRVVQRRREEAERRQAEQEHQRAAAEAARLQKEAQAREAEGQRSEAVAARRAAEEEAKRATKAQAIVEAPPAPVTVRGDYGSTAFSVVRWHYEVMDPSAIPLGYLTIDDAAVRQAIATGVRDIAGLRIFSVDEIRIKRC